MPVPHCRDGFFLEWNSDTSVSIKHGREFCIQPVEEQLGIKCIWEFWLYLLLLILYYLSTLNKCMCRLEPWFPHLGMGMKSSVPGTQTMLNKCGGQAEWMNGWTDEQTHDVRKGVCASANSHGSS